VKKGFHTMDDVDTALLLGHLLESIEHLVATARAAVAAGDVTPRAWHTPFWSVGFTTQTFFAQQLEGDGWEKILEGPSAHATLVLRGRYQKGIEASLENLLAFREGLHIAQPALLATFERLGGFHLALQGGRDGPIRWGLGALHAHEALAKTDMANPCLETLEETRKRWGRLLDTSGRARHQGILHHYKAQGLLVAAPDAPSAAIIAGALMGKSHQHIATIQPLLEPDVASHAKAVRALLRAR
jgi:hypothetical protein